MKSIQIFRLIALFTLIFATLRAQTPLKVSHSCNYYGKETEQDYYQFEPSNEARQIVNELLASSGLSASSFQLKESNCSNALATTVNGVRFILYNPDFLRKFKQDAATKWAAYGALAHEIGHHLNGHNLSETDPSVRRQYELEADKFAGNLLFHLHATVDEAQAGIKTIPLEGQTNTHPSKSARLVATTNGWTAAYDLSRKNGDADVKTPEKPVSTPKFSSVPDGLMRKKMLGKWIGNNETKSLLHFYDDYVLIKETSLSAMSGDTPTWVVKSGILYIGSDAEDRHALSFNADGTFTMVWKSKITTFRKVM